MILEDLLQYIDTLLGIDGHPDYPGAVNGLQVQGPSDVRLIAAAVDASMETIQAAADGGAQLLLVHHGLFWQGLRPLTGRRYRKVAALVRNEIGLYSAHLPLDAHPELGNCVLLARALGLDVQGRFGEFDGTPIGWWGTISSASAGTFMDHVGRVVGAPTQLLRGGEHPVRTVGVLTGGGASFIDAAARGGLDVLVTGEASHHTYIDALELGVHVVLAGHYATETYGVKALAAHLADRFDLSWEFLDHPSGL
jgi:dinuclear metal center YbgI/SA1388 family protein